MMMENKSDEELQEFKTYIKTNCEDTEEVKNVWLFYNKHVYLSNLYKYVRAKINNTIVTGYGNYNANIVIVLNSPNKRIINFFKSLFQNLHLDFNNVFVTYYQKSRLQCKNIYDKVLNMEISTIKPKIIYTIGKFDVRGNRCLFDIDKFNRMLELIDKENKSDEEIAELNLNKAEAWNKLKYIMNYY